MSILFYDFEVFKHDWLVVVFDMQSQQKTVIVNSEQELTQFYNNHINDIWCGFNSHHYDQYILKTILLGGNPKKTNDLIIRDDVQGWQINREFNKIKLYDYDVKTMMTGLKTLEGFLGLNIKETDVDFNLDRKLTSDEIEQTIKYCTHDVECTIEVFLRNKAEFDSKMTLVKEFNLSLDHVGDSSARLTALILECQRSKRDDEFNVKFFDCLRIEKYQHVLYWYERQLQLGKQGEYIYKSSYTTNVAGVPHTFAFGGLHGAPLRPLHEIGAIYHVDVNNYYPSMLIAHDLVTRGATNDNYTRIYNIRKALKEQQLNAKTKAEAKEFKRLQLPYKQCLNSLSGAMKDQFNPAFDPLMNNTMCINGQLMLLDLIEHLEAIDGFKLIQSNTDGLIIKIPNTDSAFRQMDDICYEWECRCSTSKCTIELALDLIKEIYQKDVNNYLWIEEDSIGERKGAYVKELNALDYDLPIVNKALVNYMVSHTPVETTINACNDLIEFQKLVKLSDAYEYVKHNGIRYTYKCYRVFASLDTSDTSIYKCRQGKQDKFANTPIRCFIDNENITDKKVSNKLDKTYYINLAKERLQQFGL